MLSTGLHVVRAERRRVYQVGPEGREGHAEKTEYIIAGVHVRRWPGASGIHTEASAALQTKGQEEVLVRCLVQETQLRGIAPEHCRTAKSWP